MSCPGLHCPGCSGRQSLGALVALVGAIYIADRLSVWVADRIWWIGGTVFLCFALAVAASMWLEAWADRRGARFAARHGIYSRADVLSGVAFPAELPPAGRAALGFRDLHIHLDGMPSPEQAAVIRELPRTFGNS